MKLPITIAQGLVVVAILVGMQGCKRGLCTPVSLDAFWTKQKAMIPTDAIVCGTEESDGSHTVTLDFADDADLSVKFIKHIEGQGFRRTEQKVGETFQTFSFEKRVKDGALALVTSNLSKADGRWSTRLAWFGPAE